MMEVSAVVASLLSRGYEEDNRDYQVDPGLFENGPYEVLARLRHGEVDVLIEQNTSYGTRHPAVAIVSRGPDRVSCSGNDVELILLLVEELAGG